MDNQPVSRGWYLGRVQDAKRFIRENANNEAVMNVVATAFIVGMMTQRNAL